MRDGGLDEVGIDAVGNVVGRYRAATADAPILLTGSHYDTVRNAGKYDGRLGIFVPMACVRELSRQGRRLPFQIEVVAFAEEEGQRYPATFLGSGALTGDFQPAWLDQVDADGISMREALRRAGLRAEDIPRLRRDPARYLGFIEVHIEQGPVLYELGLPLAAVTSINGCVRYRVRIQGMASHAGTTPMGSRRDAATAAAELLLYVERRAAADAGSVGTVGMLEVPNGSINVVPGNAGSAWTCARPAMRSATRWPATCWPSWPPSARAVACARRRSKPCAPRPRPAIRDGNSAGSAPSPRRACRRIPWPAAPATTP